jgi:fucose 4-O-acetylase-like acetyltransferase
MGKERLHYIDVAKGILILLVVYGHIYGASKNAGVDGASVEWIHQSVNLFVSFYMPCFFVITGFCSNFKKPFFVILTQSFKTIVLPSVFFTVILMAKNLNYDTVLQLLESIVLQGGTYWFLSSLFLARIIYWVACNKIEKKSIQNIVCIVVFIIGFIANRLYQGLQPWYFVHALLLMPFLHIGQLLKHYELKQTKYSAILFGVSLLATITLSHRGVLQIDYFYHVPGISSKLLNMNLSMFIPFVLLSVSGCLLCLGISKRINSNRVLEYLGKNSLVIYCLHIFVMSRLLPRMCNFGDGLIVLKIVLAYLLTVIICCVVAYILNLKYLRILLGKF